MSRPTPTISLTEEEASALQTILQNNRKDSIPYKRAAVVLACAEGKQGKEIAKQYEVSQNQVIKLRRKFVDGGVEGLLSNAKKGECVEMVRAALATTPPDNAESWTVSTLVKHLNIEHTSVKNALKKLDITLPENGHVVEHTFPDLKEKRVQIIGIFLSLTVQILALVITSSTDKSLFAEGKRITTTFGSTQTQEQAKDDGLGIDLVVALLSHSALPPSGNADKNTQEAAGFVRNLQDSLQKTGSQLYLVVNAPNPSSIVSDPSSIGMTLTSTDDFKSVAAQWFQTIGESSPIATRLSSGVNRLLEQSSSCSAPFIWQVSQEGHQAYRPAAVSSAQPQSAGGNSVTFTLEFKDSSGAAITSSNVLINAVPNSDDFGQCKTIQGFQNLIGDLEQGLIKGTQDLARDFMGKVINAGSASADSEVHQKKRIIEVESMLGRANCIIPSNIDTTDLFSRDRLWTPDMASLCIALVERMPYEATASLLNTIQHREGPAKFNAMTLNNQSVFWGTQIHLDQLHQAEEVLTDFGFDPMTGVLKPGITLPRSITNPQIPFGEALDAESKFLDALAAYMVRHPGAPIDTDEVIRSLECPRYSVVLIVDDILSKHQKESRSVHGRKGSKSSQTVCNTIIWICTWEGKYAVSAENTRQGLIIALGYLLKNHLLENRELVVFYDGAKVIRTCVKEIFSFHKSLRFYLDWYHVCRRVTENLSMALKCGKENRDRNQEKIREILSKIWFNQIDEAIAILESIDPSAIRNPKKITDTINYLNDRRPYLYSYAARKIAGLINSSNRVEDMNNQIVAKRQKNRGMAWSTQGSRALASLATLKVNNETAEWIRSGIIRFSPNPCEYTVKKEAMAAAAC